MMEMYALFGPEGPFARAFDGYEVRPPQQQMAERVRHLCEEAPPGWLLAVEAPTGVGKSFALLAPALLWATQEEGRVLLLTASIPLQEQLLRKDIPRLLQVLGLPVSYTLLKGRSHYLCRRRALEMTTEGSLSFGDRGEGTRKLGAWMERTATGDLDELSLPPGHPALLAAAASASSCAGRACPHREECAVTAALRRAQGSTLVVANYHLFFSYTLGLGTPFPVPFDVLLCDEAHRMAEAARSSSSRGTSQEEWRRLLGARVVSSPGDALEKLGVDLSGASEDLVGCRREVEAFFGQMRIRWGEGHTWRRAEEGVGVDGGPLIALADQLVKRFAPLAERDPELIPEEGHEILSWSKALRKMREDLAWCTAVDHFPSWAYWWDGRQLCSTPVECADLVGESMEKAPCRGVVAASATLALGGSVENWSTETGLTPNEVLVLDSPFPLAQQMELWVVRMGLRVQDPGYDALVARVVERLVKDNGGRSLVLLSSMRLLRVVGERLKSTPRPFKVLVQGDLPRGELLEFFRQDETSVLVGSVSFREGVDIPGNGLTQVIIDRIPFPHPKDPLVEARQELLGRKAFSSSALPWAKLLLKQAVGRLIRSSSDRGRAVILDCRVTDYPEWEILESLPRVPVRRMNLRVPENEEMGSP